MQAAVAGRGPLRVNELMLALPFSLAGGCVLCEEFVGAFSFAPHARKPAARIDRPRLEPRAKVASGVGHVHPFRSRDAIFGRSPPSPATACAAYGCLEGPLEIICCGPGHAANTMQAHRRGRAWHCVGCGRVRLYAAWIGGSETAAQASCFAACQLATGRPAWACVSDATAGA